MQRRVHWQPVFYCSGFAMPRFAANLSLLFTELPFLDRCAAARDAGFQGAECLLPYACPTDRLRRALDDAGLPLVLFNLPPGDWSAGERGIAALPGREVQFREGVTLALDYAEALDCPRLHCMAGIVDQHTSRDVALDTFVDNLRFAADRAADRGKILTLEPINTQVDVPGYLLDSLSTTLELIARIERPNVRLQYDAYHLWVMGEDPISSLSRCWPHIEHVQFSDAPGRHEPGSGEIPLEAFFAELDRRGYQGWVSAEYRPAGETTAGLGWLCK